MSYQFPPAGDPNTPFGTPPPTVQQPATPFAPTGAQRGRRTGLIAAGLLILAAGVAAGIVMILASGKNYDESVQNLARAPIGCTTALRFDQTGTFTIYIETKGSIGAVRGDCPGTEDTYDSTGGALPHVDVLLTDDNGDEVDLDVDTAKQYDAGGFVGRSIDTVDITTAGDYDITVTSDDKNFAVSVGKNPKKDADALRTNGIVAVVAGVVLGGALLLLGLRKKGPKQPPAASTTAFVTTSYTAPPPPAPPPGPPPAPRPPQPPSSSQPGSSQPGSSQPWVPGPITPAPPAPSPPGWQPTTPASPPGPPRLNPPNWPAPPPTS